MDDQVDQSKLLLWDSLLAAELLADAVPQIGQLTSPAIPHGFLGQAISSAARATA